MKEWEADEGLCPFSGGRTRSMAILSDRWDENATAQFGSGNAGVAAMSMADYLCGCCGVERSRNIPGYKASSLRT